MLEKILKLWPVRKLIIQGPMMLKLEGKIFVILVRKIKMLGFGTLTILLSQLLLKIQNVYEINNLGNFDVSRSDGYGLRPCCWSW